jgi:hypothetical protein
VLARIIAVIAHEIAAEYRKLDAAAPECERPHAGEHRYDPASVTSITTERAASFDHDTRPPVTARVPFGFSG